MEVVCTAYAKKKKTGTRSQHVSNKTWSKRSRNIREYVEVKHASFAKNILFRWKVLFKCVIRFSLSFRWYAFSNFCTQISRPLAHGVRISSKASATAALFLRFVLVIAYFTSLCFVTKPLGRNEAWVQPRSQVLSAGRGKTFFVFKCKWYIAVLHCLWSLSVQSQPQ